MAIYSAEKLWQLASIGKPASNGLLEIEGYLRVQIDIRFVHELELKPILADRPLIDINGPRRRATNLAGTK